MPDPEGNTIHVAAGVAQLAADALAQVAQIGDLTAQTEAAHRRLARTLDTLNVACSQGPLKTPVEPLVKMGDGTEWQADHRRHHRSGTPSKIGRDPELERFILDRIDTLTYAQIVAAVAARFSPERHVSRSGVARWFAVRRAQGQPQVIGQSQTIPCQTL